MCSLVQNVIYVCRFWDNSIIDNSILNKHKIWFDTVSNQGVFQSGFSLIITSVRHLFNLRCIIEDRQEIKVC